MERPLPGGILLKESPDRLFSPESGEGKKVPRSGSPPGRSPDRLFFLRGFFPLPDLRGREKSSLRKKSSLLKSFFPLSLDTREGKEEEKSLKKGIPHSVECPSERIPRQGPQTGLFPVGKGFL